MDKEIEETREFLQIIGMPKAQQADICCYVVLAMAGIKPDMSWSEATNEWIRIHDIIQFVNTFYGMGLECVFIREEIGMKDGKINMLVWNVNQRAGSSNGKSFYPKTVRECLHKEYDIIIFNEFYKCTEWKDLFKDTNYEYKASDNGKGKNEILIAYDKKLFSLVEEPFTWKSDYDKMLPDYLEVKLKDAENHDFVVIGSRVLVNIYDYKNQKSLNDEMKNRAMQGRKIADRLSDLVEEGCIIVGGGDMNTGRRYNKNQYWTKQIFADMMSEKINVIMPDGVSHEAYKGEVYAGCPDLLFFTRNISVDESSYDWTFAKKCKEIYNAGEYTKNIPVCYPDHAQTIVSFSLKNKDC